MSQFICITEHSEEAFSQFDGTEVVITPELVLFWKPPNPFGQWTDSPFVVDGKSYRCAEQFMMAEKARLFGDEKIEQRILNSDSPREHKQLGRQVRNFEQNRWEAERCDIVFRGNVAKFMQNETFKTQLLVTGDRRMVEASPIDNIWGIGLAADNAHAYDESRWKGRNLLGNVLEEVRSHIRELD